MPEAKYHIPTIEQWVAQNTQNETADHLIPQSVLCSSACEYY